ncbi:MULTISPECIES: HutD/Ves family protein [unclassified Rhizobium]|uniref:HutD/Ves family protein n=1 Tax=unclassified Rhizobium TaxID=2613769 RepID=UPI001ADBA03D|nr:MULTISPECIES: HutD family protein [unclassified Rhizobium]MBO9100275.1 HutD family protein [Rhizobium sp. L58/93]MBO9135567.1 HutD family protein [Rhizobium sp. B209b/85]MBO9170241.1 HutD family protein [Rhizobium sp. L245/93]MBO9186168.1 HutD family protein [Rhizobium sp. E27B/91]QXZ83093.1 HutD family protein [Rhizobium sp. K1/93]
MIVLRLSDYKRMPWKNGGGETLEIAVMASAVPNADFDWRISMATVASDGPFSRFPGIDRILTVIGGDAIELSVEGRAPAMLDQNTAPYGFPGDTVTSGRLRDGPIADLNVMARRGIAHSVKRIEASDLPQSEAMSQTSFLFALAPMAFRIGPREIALQRHDTVDLSGARITDIVVETSGKGLLIAIG